MDGVDEIKTILLEMRDNQRQMLDNQEQHLELVRQQLERARNQVDESLQLQRDAVNRARLIARFALPGIVLCLGLIIYLVLRNF